MTQVNLKTIPGYQILATARKQALRSDVTHCLNPNATIESRLRSAPHLLLRGSFINKAKIISRHLQRFF